MFRTRGSTKNEASSASNRRLGVRARRGTVTLARPTAAGAGGTPVFHVKHVRRAVGEVAVTRPCDSAPAPVPSPSPRRWVGREPCRSGAKPGRGPGRGQPWVCGSVRSAAPHDRRPPHSGPRGRCPAEVPRVAEGIRAAAAGLRARWPMECGCPLGCAKAPTQGRAPSDDRDSTGMTLIAPIARGSIRPLDPQRSRVAHAVTSPLDHPERATAAEPFHVKHPGRRALPRGVVGGPG